MVKVSVTIGTSRAGGIDVSLRGMLDQTFDDFEIILVDGRYHKRHARVLDYAKQLGIKQPFYHVPNHRYNGNLPTVMGGMNTGFMLAAGEIVIMLLDYAYAPPGWIERHLKRHRDNKERLVMSPHLYTSLPEVVTKDGTQPELFPAPTSDPSVIERILKQRENFDEISIFTSPFKRSVLSKVTKFKYPDQDPKVILGTGPSQYYYMHTKNESFPLATILRMGGVDEVYDRIQGPGDTDAGFRFLMAGAEIFVTQDAKVYCLNSRTLLPRILPAGYTQESYQRTFDYMKQRQRDLADSMTAGKPMPEQPAPKSLNPYDMLERRREIWHWRELSEEREAVIPLNDVPDEVYFK